MSCENSVYVRIMMSTADTCELIIWVIRQGDHVHCGSKTDEFGQMAVYWDVSDDYSRLAR